MLRDRFVYGINVEKIQRGLLAEPDLTFKNAVDIALTIESASKQVDDMKVETTPSDFHRLNVRDKHFSSALGKAKCSRRGGKHDASSCKFRDFYCNKCGQKGHLGKVCRNEKKKSGKAG